MLTNNQFSDLSVDIDNENLSNADKALYGLNQSRNYIVTGDEYNCKGLKVFVVKDENNNILKVVGEKSDNTQTFLQFTFFDQNLNQILEKVEIPFNGIFFHTSNIYLEESEKNLGIFILSHSDKILTQIVPEGKYRISRRIN